MAYNGKGVIWTEEMIAAIPGLRAKGMTCLKIAEKLGVDPRTFQLWRERTNYVLKPLNKRGRKSVSIREADGPDVEADVGGPDVRGLCMARPAVNRLCRSPRRGRREKRPDNRID